MAGQLHFLFARRLCRRAKTCLRAWGIVLCKFCVKFLDLRAH
jgi:hypothetical protein